MEHRFVVQAQLVDEKPILIYSYLINTKSVFLYFAVSTFSSLSLHLITEYHVSYFKLIQKCKILKHIFVRKVFTSIYHVYNI